MTNKMKVQSFDQVDKERSLNALALNDALNDAVWFSEWFPDGDAIPGYYRAGVSRMEACHGGILLLTFRHIDQLDHTAVYYLEDYLAECRGHSYSPTEWVIQDAIQQALRKHRQAVA